jgi:addiction module RelE/StbE family toxin
MAGEVSWSIQALEDIENIAKFIAKDSEFYAQLQSERFFKRVKILETYPKFGRVVPEQELKSIRQLIDGNYRIIYRIVSKSRIDILTIQHSSRLLSNNPLFGEQ